MRGPMYGVDRVEEMRVCIRTSPGSSPRSSPGWSRRPHRAWAPCGPGRRRWRGRCHANRDRNACERSGSGSPSTSVIPSGNESGLQLGRCEGGQDVHLVGCGGVVQADLPHRKYLAGWPLSGMGTVEFGGHGQQRRLGLQCRSGAVGVGHSAPDATPKSFRHTRVHVARPCAVESNRSPGRSSTSPWPPPSSPGGPRSTLVTTGITSARTEGYNGPNNRFMGDQGLGRNRHNDQVWQH